MRSLNDDYLGPAHWLVPIFIGLGVLAFLIVVAAACLDIAHVITLCRA